MRANHLGIEQSGFGLFAIDAIVWVSVIIGFSDFIAITFDDKNERKRQEKAFGANRVIKHILSRQ